jgi:hypothetical protein
MREFFPFIFLVIVILILRLPSFFEPHWYFDEGVYALFGRAIANGEIPYLYIWDHKPLGIYLIYALAYSFPFDILIGVKILAFFSTVASSILLFLIARGAFTRKVALLAAFLFAIFSSLPFFDGNQANGEIFLISPLLFAIYLIEPFSKKVALKKLFFAGLALGVAISIKQVAAVDLLLAILLLFLKEGRLIKHLATLLIGSAIIPGLTAVVTLFLGTPFKDLWFSVVEFNLFYVVSRRLGIIFNFLKFSLVAFIVLIFIKKGKIAYFPLILWLAVDSIGVLAGGQPFPHYLIQILPVSSLILAVAVTRKYSTRLINWMGILITGFFLFMFVNSLARIVPYGDVFREWHYYPAFVKATLGTDKEAFNQVFSTRWGTDRNKKVVSYLNEHSKKDELVYIWGGGTTTWLYYDLDRPLPSRYISFLHTDAIEGAEEETMSALKETKPPYIVTTPRTTFSQLTTFISNNYTKEKTIDDVEIYRIKTGR